MAARAHIHSIKGDKRTLEYRAWSRWIAAVGGLVARFDDEMNDDPLAYNEAASVSLLTAAAAKAGYLGLAEFSCVKGHRDDRRYAAFGRGDFWMATSQKSWAFEFKQAQPDRYNGAIAQWAMDAAVADARRLRRIDGNSRVGGLIISLSRIGDEEQAEAMRDDLSTFAKDRHFAWKLQGRGGEARDSYLFFDLLD